MKNFFTQWRTPQPGRRVKTPTLLQMEAVECGAAALGIILQHFGSYIPLEELRVACGVSRDGSKASNVLKAARTYGLEAKGFRHEPTQLRDLPMPAIIHWNFNHFLVLEGFGSKEVYLNDPAVGPRTVSPEEFDEAFTGVVLTFATTDKYVKQGQKPSLWQNLQPRLAGSYTALLFIVLVSLVLLVPGLLLPLFTRIFVDQYLMQQQTQWLIPLFMGLLVTAGVRSALTWLQQHYLLRLETKLALANSGRLYWHILRLPMEFFTQRSAGDVSTRVELNDRIAQTLSGELATTLINMILLLFYALLMFQYSVSLTLVGLGMALLNFLALSYVSRQRVNANLKMIKERGKMMSTAYNGLQQIETLKSSGTENDFFTRWAGYQAKVVNASQELGRTTRLLEAVPPTLAQLTTVIILMIGGQAVVQGEMTVGMLVAFQSLMASFLTPVASMVSVGGQLQELEGTVSRLNDVLNYPADPQVQLAYTAPPAEQPLQRLSGKIEITNLTFGYSRLAPPLIQNLNIHFEPGTRVALVGGSGSGKSTIARLVAGLYAPWSGQILLDGRERSAVSPIILNSSLRLVDQDLFLFEGSIRNNLTMWDEQISEESLLQAAKDAHIHAEISNRPQGYDFQVEEGGRNFSGGQRQRLEIARALVTNPSILILDEATSALDPLTEKIIDDQLRRRGCTCLIVAHRLSTIRDCDEIIVLDKGQVVERGTHDQLWRKNGRYAQLIKAESPQSERLLDSLWEAITA